jgi:hypothetical protein
MLFIRCTLEAGSKKSRVVFKAVPRKSSIPAVSVRGPLEDKLRGSFNFFSSSKMKVGSHSLYQQFNLFIHIGTRNLDIFADIAEQT